ncbi:MAG: NAD(P)/FAD-dependent oxidoreductase [Candidatus Kariarchaeaceae archaeon]|jgi:flavin-dependent dehydrogenase
MPEEKFDVAVVGGGPSGVITALGIVKAGFSCTILDKKPKDRIGDKNCGDALDALHVDILSKEMGIDPPSVEKGEARDLIKHITIAAGTLDSKFTAETPGFQVDRLAYGQRLLTEAEAAGVVVNAESTVRGIVIENNHVVGVKYFDDQQNERVIHSKITVDASGYSGIIRKLIPNYLKHGINYTFPDHHSIGSYREIVKLKSEDDHPYREEIILLYHQDIPPPGYVWIFTEGKNLLNLGITWVKSIPYPEQKSMKQIYRDCLRPYFHQSEYEVIFKGGGNIPMRPNFDSLVFNGALLVGDAAALADPTTFEGHGPALESGRLAAKTIINSLKMRSYSYKDLWKYNKDIMTYPGGMHAQSYIASILLSKIGTGGLKYLLDKNIISEEELKVIFQEKNLVISMKSKIWKFLKAFPRWNLMLTIKKYVELIEKADKIYEQYPEKPHLLNDWRKERNKILEIEF